MTSAPSPSSHSRRFGLSAFTLKIIACVAMLIDHVGAYLFPSVMLLRVIGRLAFPIFAYFIAEGCKYTRNKVKRFFSVFGLGVVCETIYVLYSGEFEGNILITFSCSILIIYSMQAVKKALAQWDWRRIAVSFLCFVLSLLLGYAVDDLIHVNYGLFGIALPAFAALFDYKDGEAPAFLKGWDRRGWHLLAFAVGLLAQWLHSGMGAIQVFAFLALIPLAFYNGEPGVKKFKYGFYLFYPLHLVIIWLIGMLLKT